MGIYTYFGGKPTSNDSSLISLSVLFIILPKGFLTFFNLGVLMKCCIVKQVMERTRARGWVYESSSFGMTCDKRTKEGKCRRKKNTATNSVEW